ncbi:hypothetical protein ABBQ32_008832 [Trebouxia sp. C0010 RCD-2024]
MKVVFFSQDALHLDGSSLQPSSILSFVWYSSCHQQPYLQQGPSAGCDRQTRSSSVKVLYTPTGLHNSDQAEQALQEISLR